MDIAFLVTSMIVVASPGTGVVYTVAAGLSRGRRASVVAAFGCTLGIVPHLAAAILGLATVLYTSAVAFEAVRWLGVAYLLYMGVRTLRDRDAFSTADAAPRSSLRIIVSAIAVNLLNPKLSIFFFAFLPQFVRADDPGRIGTMLELSGVFMAMTFVVFTAYGLFAASVRTQVLGRPRVLTLLRRAFAGAFIALGVRLAVAER